MQQDSKSQFLTFLILFFFPFFFKRMLTSIIKIKLKNAKIKIEGTKKSILCLLFKAY